MSHRPVAGALVLFLAACGASGVPGNYTKGACGAVDAGARSLDHLAAAVIALDAGDADALGAEVEAARIDAHVVSGQISYMPRNWGPGDATRNVLVEEVHAPLDAARALLPDPRAGPVAEVPPLEARERAELDALMRRARAGLETARASLADELGVDCTAT
ncbi:MAG TPA: hypothetical protein VFM19_00720 [Candidatus Limnocylindria bacterium]|nr:hypothetical protein [Candidatus Limnocylindria bacterium]